MLHNKVPLPAFPTAAIAPDLLSTTSMCTDGFVSKVQACNGCEGMMRIISDQIKVILSQLDLATAGLVAVANRELAQLDPVCMRTAGLAPSCHVPEPQHAPPAVYDIGDSSPGDSPVASPIAKRTCPTQSFGNIVFDTSAGMAFPTSSHCAANAEPQLSPMMDNALPDLHSTTLIASDDLVEVGSAASVHCAAKVDFQNEPEVGYMFAFDQSSAVGSATADRDAKPDIQLACRAPVPSRVAAVGGAFSAHEVANAAPQPAPTAESTQEGSSSTTIAPDLSLVSAQVPMLAPIDDQRVTIEQFKELLGAANAQLCEDLAREFSLMCKPG